MGDLLCGGLDEGSNELKEEEAERNAEESACDEASDIGRLVSVIDQLRTAVSDHRQHPEERRPCGKATACDEQDDNGDFPEEDTRASRT